jgi:predicted metal-dependent hydrolase
MDKKQEAESEYSVHYRNVKHPRLEFKTGSLLLVLPKSYKSEEQILEKYRNWIQRKQSVIDRALQDAETRSLNKNRTDNELRKLVQKLTQNYQKELETRIDKTYFRRMKTKWASLSHDNNLTVNTLVKYMPENLIEYVIFHELVHSKHGRKHNEEFWKATSKKFKDCKERENQLLIYWFLIQKREKEQKPPGRSARQATLKQS